MNQFKKIAYFSITKIKPGKANTRNAIELLRITQFPIDIYQRAQQNIRNL